MLYEMFSFKSGSKEKVGKSTNLFRAIKRCTENDWMLTEYGTGRILMWGYEPPNLVPHEDRSIRQLRKDPEWVAKQVFVNA